MVMDPPLIGTASTPPKTRGGSESHILLSIHIYYLRSSMGIPLVTDMFRTLVKSLNELVAQET